MSKTYEITRGVSLCAGAASITCGGRTFTPNTYNAYVEFHLGHAFPVTTVIWKDGEFQSRGTGIHPQVVANSYRSLEGKVFDFAHLVKRYNPDAPRDVVLGTIMAVEFPDAPEGGWQVQADRAHAPGIRAVAVMHKQLERVPEILDTWAREQIDWTVSMEQDFPCQNGVPHTSGWLVENTRTPGAVFSRSAPSLADWQAKTPDDLRAQGYIYIPCAEAPEDLNACFDVPDATVTKNWAGRKTIILFGGLAGEILFKGAGLCPIGSEPEARVAQMLAAGYPLADSGFFDLAKTARTPLGLKPAASAAEAPLKLNFTK